MGEVNWEKPLVLYGPHVALAAMIVAVLWLVWTMRRNRPVLPEDLANWVTVWMPRRYRPVLPQSLSGWVKLLVLLGVIFVFRDALYGIHLLIMVPVAIFWLFRMLRRHPSALPWGAANWLAFLAALVVIVVSQGFIYEINFLRRIEEDLRDFYGQPAPDIRFVRADDEKEHSLSEFRGKVVLLNFWRTSCGQACTEQMIHFERLYERYGEEGFVVVNLASDDLLSIQAHVDQYPTKTIHGSFEREFGKLAGGVPPVGDMKINGVPLIVIIDREGIVRQTLSGGVRGYEYFLVGMLPYL